MQIGSVANGLSTGDLASVQGQAQLLMLKKANELQAEAAVALVQALPQVQQLAAGEPGAQVNTFA